MCHFHTRLRELQEQRAGQFPWTGELQLRPHAANRPHMASPYALPMNGSTVHHGHGHGHVRSTNQPIAVDRLTSQYQAPIRSPLRNEASNPNLHSHAHSRAQSGRPEPDSPQKSLRHAHSTSQLPRLYVPAGSIDSAIHTNDGPNHAASAMAYPQSNGYGFPPMGGRARSGTIPTRSSLADSR